MVSNATSPTTLDATDLPLGVPGVLRCVLTERGARGSGILCWCAAPTRGPKALRLRSTGRTAFTRG